MKLSRRRVPVHGAELLSLLVSTRLSDVEIRGELTRGPSESSYWDSPLEFRPARFAEGGLMMSVSSG